ncbi:MAG: helix-turn-helix domain-containing protein [Deltaproteobacteria bacterium]|nr:helix-turn-helix domain-containing protein [Deltaproteobacteria bacterium]
MRARIVLACADGKSPGDIAEELGVAVATVSKWKRRFLAGRLSALHDLPRPNVDRKLSDEKVEELIRATLQSAPEDQTHWSTRQLADRVGVSQASVSRVWRAFKLQISPRSVAHRKSRAAPHRMFVG